jgi:hypothetical protein
MGQEGGIGDLGEGKKSTKKVQKKRTTVLLGG